MPIEEEVPPKGSRVGPAKVQLGDVALFLNFDHKVVYNRTSEPKAGVTQRQIFVEALRATPAEVESQVRMSLTQAGFDLAKEVPSSGGKRLDFRNGDGRKMSVLIRPSLNGKQGMAPRGIAQFTFRD
jgi:hypothetical protein